MAHPDQFFGDKTLSQHGEDLLLINIFHLLGIAHPSYLDIGAHDAKNISNTALLYERGSSGTLVEPSPTMFQRLVAARPRDLVIETGVGPEISTMPFYMIDATSGRNTFDKAVAEKFCHDHPEFSIREVIEVTVVTLDFLFSRMKANGRGMPDLLSIDAEGLDEAILRSASFWGQGPKVICAEIEKVSFDLNIHMELEGYFPLVRIVSNMIWVKHEYRKVLNW